MKRNTKIRVNITVDRDTLAKAKMKLRLFGGKLSTLFDAYLRDFVASMEKEYGAEQKVLQQQMQEIENRVTTLEAKKDASVVVHPTRKKRKI